MIFLKAKLFIGIFILLAYMGIGIFGLFKFNHMIEQPMTNCPYATNGFSVCDNSFDHVKNWHQFSSATFFAFSIFLFLILGIILRSFNKNFLNQEQYFYTWKYYLYNNNLFKYPNGIIKWLSLFENSPSF